MVDPCLFWSGFACKGFSLRSEGWKVCSEVLVFISELLALFEEFVLYLSSVTAYAVAFVWCCSCFHVSLLLGRNSFARILSSVYVFHVLEYFCMHDLFMYLFLILKGLVKFW